MPSTAGIDRRFDVSRRGCDREPAGVHEDNRVRPSPLSTCIRARSEGRRTRPPTTSQRRRRRIELWARRRRNSLATRLDACSLGRGRQRRFTPRPESPLVSGENCAPGATPGLTRGVRPPRSHGLALCERPHCPYWGRSFLPTNKGGHRQRAGSRGAAALDLSPGGAPKAAHGRSHSPVRTARASRVNRSQERGCVCVPISADVNSGSGSVVPHVRSIDAGTGVAVAGTSLLSHCVEVRQARFEHAGFPGRLALAA
jgi:hypothetical protein